MLARFHLGQAVIEIGEELSGAAYPYLKAIGALRMQARAGYITGLGVGETPSLTLTLNNCGNRVADILRQPLRKRCDVVNADGSFYWQGIVSGLAYDRDVTVTVSA